jgi:hypothetical protein
MIKSTLMEELDRKKKTIDSSYVTYKMRKRQISPIVSNIINTSKLQTSSNFNYNSTKSTTDLQKALYRKHVSPDTIKNNLINKIAKIEKHHQKIDKKIVIDSKLTRGMKSLPIKFINENIKAKVALSNINNPSSDRERYSTKSNIKKK